jgi:hypothetical protein
MNNSPYAGLFSTSFNNSIVLCRSCMFLPDKKYNIKNIVKCSLKILLFVALWFELVLFAIFIPSFQYFIVATLFAMLFLGFRNQKVSNK